MTTTPEPENNSTTRDLTWVPRLDYWGRRVLALVLLLALVFTAVNVQQFATGNDPGSWWWWSIAWLLDPMATITAATAIVFEVVLADHGKPRVWWLTATKWFALGCTWAANVWSSVAGYNPAGILLHSVAPGLVFLLAEAAPRVRTHLAEIVAESGSVPEQPSPVQGPAPTHPEPSWPAFPTITQPTHIPTAVSAPPTRTEPTTPGRSSTTRVDEALVRKARAWKTQREQHGHQTGWRPLQEHFALTQAAAKELARHINNNPARLEAVS